MSFWQRVKAAGRTLMATPAFNSTGGGLATKGWEPKEDAINALLSGDLDLLRRQSRDMIRRNAYACNALDSFVSNAIGSGIVPQWKHPNAIIKATLQEEWLRWTDEADASGLTDFYGLESIACRTSLEAGECLARIRFRLPQDQMRVPLQIQLLEPEHLPMREMRNLPDGNKVRWGIEFNQIGQRVAYHLLKEHPGEEPIYWNVGELTRVPAQAVCHLYKPLRPGQHRGQPWLAAVLQAIYELEKYDRAELVRKAVSAMHAVFEEDIDGNASQLFASEGEKDDRGIPITGIEPGSYVRVPYGKRVTFNAPSDVGGMYPDFMRVQLRKIAAGAGITYEQLTGDLTGVNYSSIRAGLIEFRRRCEAFQHQVIVYQFCRPILNAWLDQAALAGVIPASDYARNPWIYRNVEWTPPSWPWVDPLKDMEAEVLAIDNLIKSRSQTIKETGFDPEDVDAMIAADQEREKQNGILRRDNAASSSQQRQGETQQQ